MSISLAKGQKIDLTKGNTSLKNLHIGLGWKEESYGGSEIDLDVSAFLLGRNGKCSRDGSFIFYNNLTAPGVEHTGDERSGGSDDTDQEVVYIKLDDVANDVDTIAMVVTIDDADARRQNFGLVQDAFIRVVDRDTDKELMRFNLGEDFSIETAVVAG